MKIHLYLRKFYISVLCIIMICCARISAQNNPVENYVQQVGDYADLYNGKIETNYNIIQYENTPYYMNSDFTDASIIYRKIFLPNQKVRLDLYKEQLIVLPPDNRFGIVLKSPEVAKIFMYNKTFEWMIPPKESGMKTGFYIHLFFGKKMQLYSKESYSFQQDLLTYRFDHKIQYYLLYNDRYYPVKNKGSFSKLFKQYKKQINQFLKNNPLNFENYADVSFASLASYCEELITSTNER